MSDVAVNADSFSPPRKEKPFPRGAVLYSTGTLLFSLVPSRGEQRGQPEEAWAFRTHLRLFSPRPPHDPERPVPVFDKS